ncbi:MAG TPA: sodium:proton antiporter [Burkholderiales bacterium]|nr:sodium:proton antiporter [Burkholderiales bacterium]
MLDTISILLVAAAAFAYFNLRYLRLPTTVGVMAIALLLSLWLIVLGKLGLPLLRDHETSLLRSIDFTQVLMQGMLSLLLFAGALHVDLGRLRAYRWQVGALALIGTAVSMLIVGFGCWYALSLAGIALPIGYCLLFGALISPTDPIAVLAILRSMKVPHELETTIAAESLFNDGIGIVLFTMTLELATHGANPTVGDAAWLFAREALGGGLLGLALGYITSRLLRSIDNYRIETLITVAAVMGGYSLADALTVSGPIAMVVAGIMVGNYWQTCAKPGRTHEHIDTFWELIDEILNAVLFMLMGLEIAVIAFPDGSTWGLLLVVAITLAARFVTAGLPVLALRRWFRLPRGSHWVLTWGGVRGGISIALALSLPHGGHRELLVVMTYCVVLFSIFAQSLTVDAVARAALRQK